MIIPKMLISLGKHFILKMFRFLGINKNAIPITPENCQSNQLDFGAMCREIIDMDKVAGISGMYNHRDQDYIDRLKTKIEDLEGDMLGEEPGTDRYELLQNEVDTLIDELDNYMPGDYTLDSE